MPTRDGHEWNSNWIVSNLLDKSRNFLLDLFKSSLGVRRLGGVHLVNSNNQLLNSQSVSQQGVFSSLTILGNASFELTGAGSNDLNTTVGLRSSSDHVLDEIPVSRSINNGYIVLRSLKLPESDVDGDASLTLSLQFVKNPSILKGTLARFLGFLLELLNGSLINTSTLVDQVTCSGGLAGVYMTNYNNVDMSLLLSHFASSVRHNSLVEVNQAILAWSF